VDLPALARRVLLAAFSAGVVLAAGLPARAADSAILNIIGYSDSFRYFAFEQYGVQDGSGFPYSDIFLVDLARDSFVGGSPFRARIDQDGARLNTARSTALLRAGDALGEYGIGSPARVLAFVGDGALDTDGQSLRFGMPGFDLNPPEGEYELALELFSAPTTLDCVEWFGEEPKGFALTLSHDGVTREIHRDTRLPGSRNCAVTYRIHAVALPLWSRDMNDAVAILAVHSWGFEGADRRFIAVPLGDV